jgi:DNA-binding MarR family transcriptional regulator
VKAQKVTDLRQQPVIMLRRAVQATSAHWQDHIREATPPQYSVMLVLSDNPGISLAQVTALTLIDSATLTPLVSRLVERGLVTRTPDPASDRRKVLHLTEDGAELLESIKPRAREAEELSLAALTKAERTQLLALTTKIADTHTGRGRR